MLAKTIRCAVAAAAMSIVCTGFANAQDVRAQSPDSVVRGLQLSGYDADVSVDSHGDPLIKSRVSRTNFAVYFYGCDEGSECLSVQFAAGYDLNDGMTMDKVNEWNRTKRYAKVYLDSENDPYIETDISLGDKGISNAAFRAWLDMWERLIVDFEDYIGLN